MSRMVKFSLQFHFLENMLKNNIPYSAKVTFLHNFTWSWNLHYFVVPFLLSNKFRISFILTTGKTAEGSLHLTVPAKGLAKNSFSQLFNVLGPSGHIYNVGPSMTGVTYLTFMYPALPCTIGSKTWGRLSNLSEITFVIVYPSLQLFGSVRKL